MLGDHALLGNDATLSYHTSFDNDAMLGNHALLGNNAALGNNAGLGNNARLGDNALGNDATRSGIAAERCKDTLLTLLQTTMQSVTALTIDPLLKSCESSSSRN